jgi:hypothetical protein
MLQSILSNNKHIGARALAQGLIHFKRTKSHAPMTHRIAILVRPIAA